LHPCHLQVTKLSKGEVLMLNIGSMCTGARVLAVKRDLAKLHNDPLMSCYLCHLQVTKLSQGEVLNIGSICTRQATPSHMCI
jgi:hypothetical protein